MAAISDKNQESLKEKNILLQQKPSKGLQGAEQGLNQQFNHELKFVKLQ